MLPAAARFASWDDVQVCWCRAAHLEALGCHQCRWSAPDTTHATHMHTHTHTNAGWHDAGHPPRRCVVAGHRAAQVAGGRVCVHTRCARRPPQLWCVLHAQLLHALTGLPPSAVGRTRARQPHGLHMLAVHARHRAQTWMARPSLRSCCATCARGTTGSQQLTQAQAPAAAAAARRQQQQQQAAARRQQRAVWMWRLGAGCGGTRTRTCCSSARWRSPRCRCVVSAVEKLVLRLRGGAQQRQSGAARQHRVRHRRT
jgi:hypothetical protein